METQRPGPWVRAHEKTMFGICEVRLRPDGDYDIRDVCGMVPEGAARTGSRPAERKVPAGYVRSEICMDPLCPLVVTRGHPRR